VFQSDLQNGDVVVVAVDAVLSQNKTSGRSMLDIREALIAVSVVVEADELARVERPIGSFVLPVR